MKFLNFHWIPVATWWYMLVLITLLPQPRPLPVILSRLVRKRFVHGAVDCGLCSTRHRLEEKVAEEMEGPVNEPVDRLVNVAA